MWGAANMNDHTLDDFVSVPPPDPQTEGKSDDLSEIWKALHGLQQENQVNQYTINHLTQQVNDLQQSNHALVNQVNILQQDHQQDQQR